MTTDTDQYQLRPAIDQAERDGTLRRTVAAQLRGEIDAASADGPVEAATGG